MEAELKERKNSLDKPYYFFFVRILPNIPDLFMFMKKILLFVVNKYAYVHMHISTYLPKYM